MHLFCSRLFLDAAFETLFTTVWYELQEVIQQNSAENVAVIFTLNSCVRQLHIACQKYFTPIALNWISKTQNRLAASASRLLQ